MPEPTPANPGSPSPSPAGNTNSESPKQPGEGTAEKLVALVETMQKRLDGQSAVINRLEDALKKSPKTELPAPNTPAPQEGDLVQRVKALEASEQALKDRDAKVRKNAALQAITSKLRETGVEADVAPRFAKLIHDENAANIVVNEEADGTLKPVVKNGEQQTNLSEWLDAYFQTDSGRAFSPSVRTPKMPSGAPAPVSGPKLNITRAQMRDGKFDPKIMAKGGYNVVG